jgi:hypothetical protein
VRLLPLALASAVAGCAAPRSNATVEDARAACETYYAAETQTKPGDVENRAKPLLHSDYDDLGVELVRFATHTRRLQGHVADGNGNAAVKDVQALRKSAERIDALCAAVGVTPPPENA